MKYLYGDFSDKQIKVNTAAMHNEIHKLLLHKDKHVTETIFKTDSDFISYFTNLLIRYGGLNELLGESDFMIALMSTLQAAYAEIFKEDFHYRTFRKLILDAHGYIKLMFEEV